jgi:cystathionine beta-lyase/cystathionine gamma-synthase
MNETARDLANYLTNPNNSITVIPYQDNMGTFNNLMTLRFTSTEDAMLFYDRLKLSKGPTIGTTFSVAFPCAAVGDILGKRCRDENGGHKVCADHIGLEPLSELKRIFDEALVGDTDLVAQEGVQKKKRNTGTKTRTGG